MALWHETPAAQVGLRAAGLGVLSLAWRTARDLYLQVHAHAPAQASMAELGHCAVLFVLLVTGGALFFVGPMLWRQVSVPGRQSLVMPERHIMAKNQTAA